MPKIEITTLMARAFVEPARVVLAPGHVSDWSNEGAALVRVLLGPWWTAGRRHDLDISSSAGCWASIALFRRKAMLNRTGATINTSHVMSIAVTSNR
jgi:hypothetical protein